jgi:Cdc6-like AAA superfamily ATPase
MDIDARIRRRRRREEGPHLIRDYGPLSPVAHVEEPSDRGAVLERVLDHLDPVFEGELPPNAYVYGAFGTGKSATLTALFAGLRRLSAESRSGIHTSTRVAPSTFPAFVYVDTRGTTSEFAVYHRVLDALADESVPDHGVGTAELRDRLGALLESSRAGAVVAVDHVDDPGSIDAADLLDLFSGLPGNLSWLAVGRTGPDATGLAEYTATSIRVERYRRQVLVDVLMARASEGLVRGGLDHDLARRIADWAEGNAHDALTALFVAADRVDRAGRTRIADEDITRAIEDVPRPAVPLGRVLALPANKQLVLRTLVDLAPDERVSVAATAEAVSAEHAVDLSAGTVKRFLYEMAEVGVVERVESERRSGKGRPPSRVEPRFSPAAFRRLHDLRQ